MLALRFAFRKSKCDRVCVSVLRRNAPYYGYRTTSSLSYCINLVKTVDYDNYLSSLLLPQNLRPTAFALRAFNVEISKIPEGVTEARIMALRFGFWEDSLNDIYKDKTAVKRHKLSKLFLKRLIKARSTLTTNTTFKDLVEMEKYADFSNSPIYMLLLEASGVKNVDCDHVASHLGRAQGIANLLRALPFNIKSGLILLPMTILMKHKVSEENFLRYNVEDEVCRDIILEVATMAHNHLNHIFLRVNRLSSFGIVQKSEINLANEALAMGRNYLHLKARSLKEKVPVEHRSLFLPAVTIDSFLTKLQYCNFNVFSERMFWRSATLPINLYFSMLMKKY